MANDNEKLKRNALRDLRALWRRLTLAAATEFEAAADFERKLGLQTAAVYEEAARELRRGVR